MNEFQVPGLLKLELRTVVDRRQFSETSVIEFRYSRGYYILDDDESNLGTEKLRRLTQRDLILTSTRRSVLFQMVFFYLLTRMNLGETCCNFTFLFCFAL